VFVAARHLIRFKHFRNLIRWIFEPYCSCFWWRTACLTLLTDSCGGLDLVVIATSDITFELGSGQEF